MRISSKGMFTNQMAMISKQYERVAKLQNQIDSDMKIQSGSENPVLASRIQSTQDQLNLFDSFKNNEILAKNRVELFNTKISTGIDQLKHVRELIQKAGNGTLNDNDRAAIATELDGIIESLVGVANTKDANGEYVFSGHNVGNQPYIKINGSYQYQGGDEPNMVDISPDLRVIYTESGFNAFGDIMTGNGIFTVSNGPANNTGSSSVLPGSVFKSADYVPDTYTINYVTNSNGKIGYQVTGATTGQILPPPPANLPGDAPDYIPDSDIQFNGINLHLTGQPNVGDQFTVAPSKKQNMFDTLSALSKALKTPLNAPSDIAKFKQSLSQAGVSFDQIFNHLVGYQSELGSRANQIDQSISNNDNSTTQQQIIWQSLAKTNQESAISELLQTMSSMETAQKTYVKIQELFQQLFKL